MTPQQLLERAADRVSAWPIWPAHPISAALAMSARLPADAFDDPDADLVKLAAAEQALRGLARQVAIRTGTQAQEGWADPDTAREGLDYWARLADRHTVAETLRATAQTSLEEVART